MLAGVFRSLLAGTGVATCQEEEPRRLGRPCRSGSRAWREMDSLGWAHGQRRCSAAGRRAASLPKGGNQETSHALPRDLFVAAGLHDERASGGGVGAGAFARRGQSRAGAPLSGDDLRVLAAEQAALRRVATLVARGAAPEEVFAAVTGEIGRLLPVDSAGIGRYEPDGTVTFVASWGRAVDFVPVGSRWSAGGKNLGTIVFETGRPARIDSYSDASGRGRVAAREQGVRSCG